MITSSIIIIVVMILFSSFFSGMEIAFLSANRLKLELDKKSNRTFSRIAEIFSHNPGQYITTILVGNNIALVIYSLEMTRLMGNIFSHYGIDMGGKSIVVETIVSTIIIIFTAEFLPKAVVKTNPNFYFRILYAPLFFFYVLFYPIAKFSTWLSSSTLKMFGVKMHRQASGSTFNKIDLAHLVEQSSDNEQENANENIKLFQNALDFSEVKVRHCMVPRVDMEAIEIHAPIDELQELFAETRFSRIPVYEGSIDNIVGYVNSKSMFTSPCSIRDIMIKIDYVTESMSVQKLLSNFTKQHTSLAIVIDEFGGTAGMITLEDILEEIFGEIEDEHDSTDLIEKQIRDMEYVFSCRLEVDYLNEKYNLDIPENDEYDTLAGYIIYRNDGLPKKGDVLVFEDKKIQILKSSSSKLDLVKIEII